MSLLNISDLSFYYEGSYDYIFEHVTFSLDTDWKLGFIGRNGRGKTTFLKLLMGELEYRGRISAAVNFEYFPYEIEDEGQTSMEVAFRIYPDLMDWELERELSLLSVPDGILAQQFVTLSPGERVKLLLAVMFLKPSAFLLIDEPTNHLDMDARDVVSRYLRGKRGFILVSHDRAFLDGCIDHVLSINKMNIEVQRGNFSSWFLNKQRQDDFERSENERLSREVKGLREAARQAAAWSDKLEATKKSAYDSGFVGAQAARMMKRSKSIEARRDKAADDKEKLLRNVDEAEKLKLSPLDYHKERLIEAENLTLAFGSRTIFTDLDFTIRRGTRTAIIGKNGSGKSSILRMILGELTDFYSGKLTLGNGLIISYVSQQTDHLQGALKDYAAHSGIDYSLFLAILRKLDFSRIQFEKDMRDFSSGQKKKVLIARSLCERAHLYIWDEPLNYIDVLSRIQIEELILVEQPTLLFVEHDRSFSDRIATNTIIL